MSVDERIYIGTSQFIFDETRHSYLFFDPDTDMDDDPTTGEGMQIIRGGTFWNYGADPIPIGPTVIEVLDDAKDSKDWFGEHAQTPGELFFTVIAEGDGVGSLWADMRTFAVSLGDLNTDYSSPVYDTGVFYKAIHDSCNSVTNTILSYAGYNFRGNLPDGLSELVFPGHLEILDGKESDVLTAFSYDWMWELSRYVFHDKGGNDYFVIEDGAVADILKDADPESCNNIVLTGVGAQDYQDIFIGRDGDDLEIQDRSGALTTDIADIQDHYRGLC